MSEITDCQLEQAGYQKLSAPLPACAYDVLDEVLDSVVQENFRRRRNSTRYAIRQCQLSGLCLSTVHWWNWHAESWDKRLH